MLGDKKDIKNQNYNARKRKEYMNLVANSKTQK